MGYSVGTKARHPALAGAQQERVTSFAVEMKRRSGETGLRRFAGDDRDRNRHGDQKGTPPSLWEGQGGLPRLVRMLPKCLMPQCCLYWATLL
jgi:hypothetical protein